jgi:hypothetical protein
MDALPEGNNFRYLATELRQIDTLVQSRLQAALASGEGSIDQFRGLYVSQEEALDLSRRRDGQPAGADDSGQDELRLVEDFKQAQAESRRIEEETLQAGGKLPLLQLREYFGLSDFEYRAFLICLLPAIDLRYERVYGFLQDDVTRKKASVQLILALLEATTPEIARLRWLNAFSATGTLLRYHLLRPVPNSEEWQEPRLNQLFEVPPALVAWLLDDYFPEKDWLHMRSLATLEGMLANDPHPQDFSLDWESILHNRPLLSFEGLDEDRQRRAAVQLAVHYHMPLLEVDLRRMSGEDNLDLPALRLIIRDACLYDAVPYLRGFDRVLDENGFIPAEILEEMAAFAGIFILGSQAGFRVSRQGGRAVFSVPVNPPNSLERANLWKQAMRDDEVLEADTLRNLASQFELTSGQIENALFVARNESLQSGQPVSGSSLFRAARQQSTHHLAQLAQKIEPRYHWENIVLPDEELGTLKDLVAMMRYRSLVLEEWGVGKQLASSSGVSALFAGEPGTGKTLAAQVIAAELELDLYRIDLSRVVSKYIGETEKNLDQIFDEAQNSNAILFFDEADAIFGKRSEVKDAHDRYANIEVGYLLQRMETYSGMTILATNLRTNLDDAFTRRLNFIVNFPFPDEAQRLRIWKVLIPAGLPRAADIDWEFLARKYSLAGGNIRNILVAAAFLAAQNGAVVNMTTLLQAARQEMQKNGRFIKEEDYIYRPS